MVRNMGSYDVGKYAVGSLPPKEITPYGLISVMPSGEEGTREIRLGKHLAKIGSRANTIPSEVLFDIVNGHPKKFEAAADELYNRLLVPATIDEAFHLIYVPKRVGDEAVIELAVAVTSGYPISNHPLIIVYSNAQPVVAVSAETAKRNIMKGADELKALNELIAAELKSTFDEVEPPFLVFEDGTLFPLAVRPGQIFNGGLERRFES